MNLFVVRSADQGIDLVQTVDFPCVSISAVSYDRANVAIETHVVTVGAIRPLVTAAAYGYDEDDPAALTISDDSSQAAGDFKRGDRVRIGHLAETDQWATESFVVASYNYADPGTQALRSMDGLRNTYASTENWRLWNLMFSVAFTGTNFTESLRNLRLDIAYEDAAGNTETESVLFDVVARKPRRLAKDVDLKTKWYELYMSLQRRAEDTGLTIDEDLADAFRLVCEDIHRRVPVDHLRDQRLLIQPTLYACRWKAAQNSVVPLGTIDYDKYVQECFLDYRARVNEVMSKISLVDHNDDLDVDAGEENLSRHTLEVWN